MLNPDANLLSASLRSQYLAPGDLGNSIQSIDPVMSSKFADLMQRQVSSDVVPVSEAASVRSAVSKVETHLERQNEAVEAILALDASTMSMAEVQAASLRNMTTMTVLQMNQSACITLVSTSKSTISGLMKNQ